MNERMTVMECLDHIREWYPKAMAIQIKAFPNNACLIAEIALIVATEKTPVSE